MLETPQLKVIGSLKITDVTTGEILVDKNNQIHFENMSLAIANGLGRKPTAGLEYMVFGNGGSTVNGVGAITYLSPNTIGASATLYNQTYQKIVDNLNINNADPTRNRIDISHVTGNLFSDVIIQCFLDLGEPVGQDAFDQAVNTEGDFVFDEIGLKDYAGNLLTHVIFSPVQKSANRIISIFYTVRCQLV